MGPTTADRPRVVQVAWRLSPGGGKTLVARDLALHHDPSGVDLHTVSMRPLFAEDDLEPLRRVAPLHSLGVTDRSVRAGATRAMPRLDRTISRIRPDVLHLHAGWDWWSTPLLLRRPRLPVVVEVHDPPGTGKATTKHAWFLQGLARRPAVRFVAHSEWTRDQTAHLLHISPDRIDLLPLGIPLPEAPTEEQRRAARHALGIPDGTRVVLYVARLEPTKRPSLFVDVARHVLERRQGVAFVLVGRGTLDAEVRVGAAGLEPGLRTLGYVEDLATVHAAADVFLSTSAYEGFGLGVAEAMARGAVPVVASRAGGLRDVVGEAGRLVADDSVEELANAVCALLDDPEAWSRLRGAAMDRVRSRFDLQDFVQGTQDIWRDMAAGGRRR